MIKWGIELKSFLEFCKEHGIKHLNTVSYTPQQNDIVERRNWNTN